MIINVKYHHEDGSVWAESAEVEGLAVAADTLAQARELVRDGLPFYVGEDVEIDLREEIDGRSPMVGTFAVPSPDLYFSLSGPTTAAAPVVELNISPTTPSQREREHATAGNRQLVG